MDGSPFDRLARLAATSPARRGLLRSGLATILAGIGATFWFGPDDAEAKSCEKKCYDKKSCKDKNDKGAKKTCKAKCKKKCLCNPKLPQETCGKSGDCCPDVTSSDQLCINSSCVARPIL
jgi:hypothetical protein